MKPVDMVVQEFNRAKDKAELLGAWPFSDLDTYDEYYYNTANKPTGRDIILAYVKLWINTCNKYSYIDPFDYYSSGSGIYLRCKGNIPVTYENPIPIFVRAIWGDAFKDYSLDTVELEVDFDKNSVLDLGEVFGEASTCIKTVRLKLRSFTRSNIDLSKLFENTPIREIYLEEFCFGKNVAIDLSKAFSSPNIETLEFQAASVEARLAGYEDIFANTNCYIDSSCLNLGVLEVIDGVHGTLDNLSCFVDIEHDKMYLIELAKKAEKNKCNLIVPYSLQKYKSSLGSLGSRIKVAKIQDNSKADIQRLARDELKLYNEFKSSVKHPKLCDIERLMFEWVKLCYKYNYKDPLI